MPQFPALPSDYMSARGHKHPLRLGGWAYPAWWSRDCWPSPVKEYYLWKIEELQPGAYEIVAQGSGVRLKLTADLAFDLCPLEIELSDRLRMEDYPEHLERFRAQGIGVYFRNGFREGSVMLEVRKPRVVYEGYLPKLWVLQGQKDAQLMGRWLDQALWCITHPRKSDALRWVTRVSEHRPFGEWPNLAPAKHLDTVSKLAMPIYRKFMQTLKDNPPTEEEMREAQRNAMWAAYHNIEKEQEQLKQEATDEQGLKEMLIGFGIRPAGT
ncbi:hypothetical protein [Hymenobacter guriensis]|uniref:Uncharacterized protein n=1 Tax=Hymenobacter guriensis TaxID=2793065 RepID=A0ABS0L7S0_9BACT|nr:hypothetical protein [Hymenobacter guriensis]MBG8556175.1 hypothetical protein [Hymenobacter guriensis]